MKRRLFKTLTSVLLILVLLIGATPVSAASVSTNYDTIVEFIRNYGEVDDTGYKTVGFYMIVEGGTMYFYLRNYGSGVQFQFVALGSEADRSDLDMSFTLTKYGNTIPVKFQTIYYEDHTYIDKVNTSVSINRTTFSQQSEYSVRGSTHISDEDATLEFNYGLQILCLFWDSYFWEAFGFGLNDLGFTSYCSHQYDHGCDPDCNLCGMTREVSHNYCDWIYVSGQDSHRKYCQECKTYLWEKHDWVLLPVVNGPTCQADGYETYQCTVCRGSYAVFVEKSEDHHKISAWQEVDGENHCGTCQICQEEKTVPHNWDEGQITQLPTADLAGIITYTCSDCGATKTEELNFIPGDIDGNGTVNRDDVIALLLHVSMPAAFPISIPADYNGDGQVTRDDVIQLLLHVSMPNAFPLQ